ncbi:MAG: hypothetical protein AB4368_27860 [Xenococcaceae cyanobacterium]
MVKTKPNQKIHVDKLQTTLAKLGQLKEKPKEKLNLRESIYYLREKLKSALKKGYSYQDLSEILAEQEILISDATLKQYLTEINKQSAARKKRISSAQSKKNDSSESESNSLASSEDVTLSKDESNKSLNQVEPDKVKKVESASHLDSKSDVGASKSKSQTKTKVTSKSIKTKPKELSGTNVDLSEEFNQY